ncbi:FG-GAP-like repeat-containing protein [Synoicihabitans lomoniglobus]|uniref:FG-GAP-like repeat-containing protein n=1 Tax=Synoicihabitans lomoniglobus TaxID=2909285 RepID=A0AAF0CIF6_9BACT|nr:FG-GAP-like repeat-containing protein [Opitutaceae bacterium LMO-M01]WED65342.1 FG-GAP-like repeat-containing protein [Opitutaceae bacterium LMO-M01]
MNRHGLRCAFFFGGLIPAVLLSAALEDVTTASGLVYQHADQATVPLRGATEAGRITKTVVSNHAGAAAVDVDGDGWTDLLTARYDAPPLLFRNRGDGTFVDEAIARGLGAAVNAAAFGAGDLDNDGDADLVVVMHRGSRHLLFINDGTGHFTEQAVARGAAVTSALADHESYSVGLVDYDRDGWLDIYVSEWGVPDTAENALHSVLLRNRGAVAPAHFTNVTAAAGLVQPPVGKAEHFAFSSAWADFDDDGWPDLALVADFGSSRMYWNNGDGTFTDGTAASGLAREEFGMGVAVADYDGDGRLDLFVTSIYEPFFHQRSGTHEGNKLYRNLGDRRFAEVATTAGVDRTGWGWGAAFFDYENDGDPDLMVANGMDASELGPAGPFYAALTDQTALRQNDGSGRFNDFSNIAGVRDTGLSKAVVVWDYDNDGDEDVLLTQTFGPAMAYRNTATANGNRWIRFKFRGHASNRSGYGAVVTVSDAGASRTNLFNPTNAYIGQREGALHFGLGAHAGSAVDRVTVRWPSGVVQRVENLATNQLHVLEEPDLAPIAPVFTTQPTGGEFELKQRIELSVEATGIPAPIYEWKRDGVTIAGATGQSFTIERAQPIDAGRYTVVARNPQGTVDSDAAVIEIAFDPGQYSVARWWNEFLLAAIRKDYPDPPVHARNLYHLSAVFWDTYWAYHPEGWSRAEPIFSEETITAAGVVGGREAAHHQATCYAAYRLLTERFRLSPGAARSLFGFRWLMAQFGYDPDHTLTAGDSPAAVGNRIAAAVLAATLDDGANERGRYADLTGYASVNEPMIVATPGTAMVDPNAWQPLALAYAISQNGIPIGESVQTFVGVNARNMTPFALVKPTPTTFAIDPGPPPQLGTATDADFKAQALEVIAVSAHLDPADGETLDISPGSLLNNPLGTNAGTGHALNPVTGEAYVPNIALHADYGRVLAEFWADGPSSETPPGHWNVLFNEIADDPRLVRRYAGQGAELSALEWDVRGYLALNGGLYDAALTAWGVKRIYDSARPISMIRYMGGLGQSSDPAQPSYHADGLPLVEGMVEVITTASAATGQRHAHLSDHIGEVAIRAWAGKPADIASEVGGVDWILATTWVPYQLDTFVSPAFPGYVSGHSTFSRAAAEVLTLLTGTPFFPGGLGEFHFDQNDFLRFEIGPAADITLQWATYYDAADQAGRSRLYGGIHIAADDVVGRMLGSQVGMDAFLKAQALRQGRAVPRGLLNLSTRGRAGAGNSVLIAGFVMGGDESKEVLLRSVGPTLGRLGVDPVVRDPRLALYPANATESIQNNDAWHAGPRADRVEELSREVGAFALDANSADAADVATLGPGGYTVINEGAQSPDEIVLTEVYGRDLVNLSTRGEVGDGDGVLIAGFVIETADPALVLIRGIGPSLAPLGVTGALLDPRLSVFRRLPDGSTELIASNDNWQDDARASLTLDASHRAGAFAIPSASADAALVLQLPSGVYSVHVSGADGTSGIALAEIYHVE